MRVSEIIEDKINILKKGYWRVHLKSGYTIDDRTVNCIEQQGSNYELKTITVKTNTAIASIIPMLLAVKKISNHVKSEVMYIIPQDSINYAEWVSNE